MWGKILQLKGAHCKRRESGDSYFYRLRSDRQSGRAVLAGLGVFGSDCCVRQFVNNNELSTEVLQKCTRRVDPLRSNVK